MYFLFLEEKKQLPFTIKKHRLLIYISVIVRLKNSEFSEIYVSRQWLVFLLHVVYVYSLIIFHIK